jgi:hypothetical protein
MYRILSLDGGGTWSLIQAKCLLNMFGDLSGRELLSQFDLVVANSGGSIVAAGLAENYTLSQICDLFEDETTRQEIFDDLSFMDSPLDNAMYSMTRSTLGVGPKYSARRKYEALKKYLPSVSSKSIIELPTEIQIDNSTHKTHFLIAAFDYHRNRSVFFRSNQESKAQTFALARMFGMENEANPDSVTLVQAVHASTNAPINYFDEPARITTEEKGHEKLYWDGAVAGYNNPVLAGIIEAICNDISTDEIAILSIGTGSKFLPLSQEQKDEDSILFQDEKDPRLSADIVKLAHAIMADPPDSASFIAYTMLFKKIGQAFPQHTERFVRLNPMIQPLYNGGRWTLPKRNDHLQINEDDFRRLISLDMDVIRKEDIKLISKFCDAWLKDFVPNQPIRWDSHLECIIGHRWYSQGKKDWLKGLKV